jgi:hypothetical protein
MYKDQMPQRRIIEWAKFEGGEISPTVYGENSVCPYTGGDCYYDGTSLGAERVWGDVLAVSDPEVIWYELLQRYKYLEEEAWDAEF